MAMIRELIDVGLRTAVVYASVLVILRLAGKRHSGALSPHDFVVMLLIANAVQNAMVGNSTSVPAGVFAVAVLLGVNVVLSKFLLHHHRFGPLIAGRPTLLVHNGLVLMDALQRDGVLLEELEAGIRGHGFASAQDVKIAVHEVDGSISVIGFYSISEVRIPTGRSVQSNTHSTQLPLFQGAPGTSQAAEERRERLEGKARAGP